MKDTLVRRLSLEGKVAIVTGAGRGIGQGIARRLAEAGAAVFVTDVNEALLQETLATLRQSGAKAQGQVMDGRQSGAGEQATAAGSPRSGGSTSSSTTPPCSYPRRCWRSAKATGT